MSYLRKINEAKLTLLKAKGKKWFQFQLVFNYYQPQIISNRRVISHSPVTNKIDLTSIYCKYYNSMCLML